MSILTTAARAPLPKCCSKCCPSAMGLTGSAVAYFAACSVAVGTLFFFFRLANAEERPSVEVGLTVTPHWLAGTCSVAWSLLC